MGTVWLARMSGKLGFERMVALKTILPTYSSDRQFCDMFLDEAKIAAQIDHENVARILEIGEDRGILYYAMELIDGESLRKLYRDVRAAKMDFPLGVALRIVSDACAGLHATHELHGEDGRPLQVVHRDVSPQNLLISIRGTTKLIDFGVAKANARSSEETAAGTLKGKIEYMAPEQARGEPLDRRADVYSLGAVLYELLAGRAVRATDEGRQLAALHELMTDAPYQPLPESIPYVVRGIVERALARDPRARFASADALRQALEQAMLATGQGATTEEVARVLAQFSGERTSRRKDAIERAVRAATEGRVAVATLIATPSARPQQGSGSAPGGGGSGTAPGSQPGAGHASTTGPFLPVASSPPSPFDGPGTGPSMRTIGAASMSAHPMPGSSAAKIFAGVIVLGLVLVMGVVAGVFVTRRGQRPPPAVTATAPPASGEAPNPSASALALATASAGSDSAVATPTTPATGIIAGTEVRDAGAARTGKDGGAGRKGGGKGGGKTGTKGGDGDEYGF